MLYTCNHFRVLKVLIQENKLDLFGSATVARLLSGIFKTNNQSQRELVLIAALTLIPHTLTSTRTHKCFEWDTSSACFYFVLNLIYSNACGIILFVTQLRESKTVCECEWVWMNTMWPRFCLDVSVYLHRNLFSVMSDSFFCVVFTFLFDAMKTNNKVSICFLISALDIALIYVFCLWYAVWILICIQVARKSVPHRLHSNFIKSALK